MAGGSEQLFLFGGAGPGGWSATAEAAPAEDELAAAEAELAPAEDELAAAEAELAPAEDKVTTEAELAPAEDKATTEAEIAPAEAEATPAEAEVPVTAEPDGAVARGGAPVEQGWDVVATPGDQRPAVPSPGQESFFGGTVTVSDALADLASRARSCRRCALRDGCRGVVFGEGDPDSRVLFVGEAPGAVEDELGRPFVGPAGQLLDRILLAVGFRRESVYISNTVLCRPPGNRVPLPEEVTACRVWLDERLAVMKPRVIVCLGASAAQNLLGPDLKITRDRGKWFSLGDALVMPTFHPAAVLRDPSKKRPIWEDMKAVRAECSKSAG